MHQPFGEEIAICSHKGKKDCYKGTHYIKFAAIFQLEFSLYKGKDEITSYNRKKEKEEIQADVAFMNEGKQNVLFSLMKSFNEPIKRKSLPLETSGKL